MVAVAGIGSLNERPLHAALKRACAPEGARFEVRVDGFVIDAVHDGELIEIQTRNAGALRRKLTRLLARHPVRLILPVARTRWIVKRHPDGRITRRKSPRRGQPADVFRELVGLPGLLPHPNLTLEIVLICEEEWREHRAGRAWRRRGWVTVDRRLVAVEGRERYHAPADLLELLPPGLPDPFTSADLAEGLGARRRLGQQMGYCLTTLALLERVGKRGNAYLYRATAPADAAGAGSPADG